MKKEYGFGTIHRCQLNLSVHPDGEIYCQAPAYVYVWGTMWPERKWIPYEEGWWLCPRHFDLVKVKENFNQRYKRAEEN